MSMSAQMNRYETCSKCGGPVLQGRQCNVCTTNATAHPLYAPMDNAKEPQGPLVTHPPMSLRDYFAGQALAGMCAADRRWDNGKWDMAVASYSLADAMLAARKEQPHD